MRRALATSVLAALATATLGCADRQQLVAQLERATAQPYLPQVVACYERHFEAAGFRGEFLAVVSFTVNAGTGAIRDARVQELREITDGGDRPVESGADALRSCLVQGLEHSSLAAGGMTPGGDVEVVGMRIAFRDASKAAREQASAEVPNVLIGPRADRCLGLYDYEPPRETTTLLTELDDALRLAARFEREDRDRYARELQRAYDVALELCDRLRLDADQPGLAREGRTRLLETLARTDRTSREVGAKIGCKPPPLP